MFEKTVYNITCSISTLMNKTISCQIDSVEVYFSSNGMGRTGTYIALDALFKTGKTSGFINVEEYVKSMRSSRMDMVPTYVC